MKMKKSRAITLTVIAVLLAIYILFPFFLVVLNSFKTQAAIVQDPISAAGASFKQFTANLNNVINNKNFVFWHAFGSSAVVTIISLILGDLLLAKKDPRISLTTSKGGGR